LKSLGNLCLFMRARVEGGFERVSRMEIDEETTA
jgi:hypothetical protein